jgi:hypothetical protein
MRCWKTSSDLTKRDIELSILYSTLNESIAQMALLTTRIFPDQSDSWHCNHTSARGNMTRIAPQLLALIASESSTGTTY